MTVTPEIQLSCAELSERELAEKLRGLSHKSSIKLVGLVDRSKISGLAAGVSEEIVVDVEGSVGDFLFLLGAEASIEIRGSAGACCCHSMVSGQVLVNGNVGDGAAAYAAGGYLAVLGKAGNRCGHGLAGGDVLVRSKVGDQAGYGMRQGALLLGNGAGEQLGYGMTGGVIYVRGPVQSRAENIRSVRLKDGDLIRLSLMLARAGIKASGSEFRAFRAKASES